MKFEQAILIRNKTRLEQLVERFNTKAQAEFYIDRSGGDFQVYEREHEVFYEELEKLQKLLNVFPKYKVLDRSFLTNYLFNDHDLIVVLGQDGLVANTAKYVNGQPIAAFNPNPKAYDGVLLPFTVDQAKDVFNAIVKNTFSTKKITMAEAEFNDGQKLLAFNDFFIGPKTHVSARYKILFEGNEEVQSSSGVLVSTGAGSTGWMSSVFNMAKGIFDYHDQVYDDFQKTLNWETNELMFAVREPFLSKETGTTICFGKIRQEKLKLESLMPEGGIIFSDGIEADAIPFNAGAIVEVGIAKEKANIITKF